MKKVNLLGHFSGNSIYHDKFSQSVYKLHDETMFKRIDRPFLYKITKSAGGERNMPNLNDNKFRKIQSESQKQGKSQEEYAAELENNKMKAQKRK